MLPNNTFISISDNLELVKKFINEIIILPRQQLKQWAAITNQTPAAKVGYVGQHLASLLTGVRGTGSGARGDDLADGSEVKSCNKTDQADKCKDCGSRVLRMEDVCGNCGSSNIQRKEDSKWLFSVSSEEKLEQYLHMNRIVLILMDYPHFEENDFNDIRVCAFEIYPQEERMNVFRDLITNHYWNIYRKKADDGKKTNPMNFHPWSIQFYKCNPIKTFECIIRNVDEEASIEIVKYVEPNIDRNLQLKTEPMPTTLLQKKEWDVLLEKTSYKKLVPFLRDPRLTEKEFVKLNTKKKADALPFLNEELRNLIPLRDIKSVTQATQYHRT